MLLGAILLSLPLQQAVTPDLLQFQQQAEARLLAGRSLWPDYRQDLLAMPPEDRIEAIIYLRRIGLLTGKSWQIGDLLKPAKEEKGDQP